MTTDTRGKAPFINSSMCAKGGFPLPIKSTRSTPFPNFPIKPDQARLKGIYTTAA